MNIHQLRLFRTVVEKGSFSLASREILISQPALSVQVKRLERDLGIRLLKRTRTGVSPTAAGQELYSLAMGIFEQIESAERRLNALRSGDAGSLSIATSHTGSLYFLTDVVKAFSQENPSVEISITVESVPRVYEAVQRGTVDVALQWGPLAPSNLQSVELFREPFGAIASTQHQRAESGTIQAKQFVDTPFIIFSYGIGEPSFIEVQLVELNMLPSKITPLPSIDAVKRLVEANLGLTIMSQISVERELEAGRLTWLRLAGFRMERPLLLVMRERARSLLLNRFVEHAQMMGRLRRPVRVSP